MSDTIAPLFSIMLDEDEFMSRRLEAAEQILGFESPPDAVEATKAFLRKVYKGKTASRRDKLKAIGLIRRAEDRKTLEPCENLVGGRFFPRLDAIDISVDFVVALRESPELIIGSYHPLDKRDLLRKLIS